MPAFPGRLAGRSVIRCPIIRCWQAERIEWGMRWTEEQPSVLEVARRKKGQALRKRECSCPVAKTGLRGVAGTEFIRRFAVAVVVTLGLLVGGGGAAARAAERCDAAKPGLLSLTPSGVQLPIGGSVTLAASVLFAKGSSKVDFSVVCGPDAGKVPGRTGSTRRRPDAVDPNVREAYFTFANRGATGTDVIEATARSPLTGKALRVTSVVTWQTPVDCASAQLGFLATLDCAAQRSEPVVARMLAGARSVVNCAVGVGSFLVPETKLALLADLFRDGAGADKITAVARDASGPARKLVDDLIGMRDADPGLAKGRKLYDLFKDAKSLSGLLHNLQGLLGDFTAGDLGELGRDVANLLGVGSCLDLIGRIVHAPPPVKKGSPPATTWTATEAPLPPGVAGDSPVSLSSASCPAVGSCVVVGYYSDSDGTVHGLIEVLSNGHWTAIEAPAPSDGLAGASPRLTSVSCTAPGTCVAAGSDETGSESTGLVETLSDGEWTPTTVQTPGYVEAAFESVSCATAGSCAAVGSACSDAGCNNDAPSALVASVSDGMWTAEEPSFPPDPTTYTQVGLNSVQCLRAGSCVAIGSEQEPEDPGLPIAAVEQPGAGWSSLELPLPPGATAGQAITYLRDLSCPNAGSCIATGEYETTLNSGYMPLTETLTGSSWAAGIPPSPTGYTINPTDVSCSDAADCVLSAIGANESSGVGVLETLAGGAWSIDSISTPGGLAPLEIDTVTCESSSACVAAGADAGASSATTTGLLITLSDGTWTAVTAPMPFGTAYGGGRWGASACAGPAACVVAGNLSSGAGLLETSS
jgi:hypothetical protein